MPLLNDFKKIAAVKSRAKAMLVQSQQGKLKSVNYSQKSGLSRFKGEPTIYNNSQETI